MKQWKRWIALGISVTMLASALLTGCGKDQSGKNNGNDTTGNTAATAGQDGGAAGDTTTAGDTTATGDAANAGNDGAANAQFTEVSLPLTEETQTLTVWMKNDVTLLNACGGDMNNTPFFKKLEELTNVHIEWIIPASGSEQEQLNLMFSSGELADLMFISPGMCEYGDGLDAAVEDGYFLDLTEYLPQYAPNYLAAVNASSETIQKGVKTDQGRYVLMPTLMQEEQPPFMGYVVRQDWLDDLGLDTPVTYDDWENMLTKFKEEKGASAPFSMTPYSIWALGVGMGVYGDHTGNFYQIDGKVYNSLYDQPEAVKEYLTLLNRWYTNGLIDPDFASETISSYYGNSVLVTNNSNGCFSTMYTLPSTMFLPSMEEGAALSPILPPAKNAGDTLKYRGSTTSIGASYAISADCKNPELAIRWIDYLFSEAGALMANYGTEGDTYTLDESGSALFTDTVLNNPDGLSFDECLRTFTLAPGMPSAYMDYKRELQYIPEQDVNMMYKWAEVTDEYYYPANAQMTAEENAEYSTIYADLGTFIQENCLSFITGAKNIDEFDAFIEAIKGMGLDRCIELKQAALDRYNAR